MPPDPQAMVQAGIALSLVRMGFGMHASPSLAAVGTTAPSLPGSGTTPLPGTDRRKRPRCCLPSAGRESSPSGWRGRASSRASLGALPGRREQPRHQPQHRVTGRHIPPPPPPSSSSSQPCHSARHPTPGDRRHARTVPAHLSPCRPRGWQMVLLAGGAACRLPGPAPLRSPPRRSHLASPLPPCSGTGTGMGTRWCCPPGNAGFGGRLHLIRSRRH